MKALIFILSITLLQSCGSAWKKHSLASDKEYIEDINYQSRKELKKSFFKKTESSLSEKQIKTLLSSKVNLKKPLKVAVVKLTQRAFNNQYSTTTIFGSKGMQVTEKNASAIKGIVKKSRHIKDISFIPSFMMPEENTIRSLRDTAALFQADLLLIIQTKSHTDYEYNLLANNEAKASASIEAIMVDVRTGVIPFSAITTGTEHSKRTYGKGKDFSNKEMRIRATVGAEDNAISKLAEDIGVYFN